MANCIQMRTQPSWTETEAVSCGPAAFEHCSGQKFAKRSEFTLAEPTEFCVSFLLGSEFIFCFGEASVLVYCHMHVSH